MKFLVHYGLVVLDALLIGAALVFAGFLGMDLVWTRFVPTDPTAHDLGKGIMFVGGSFAIASIVGLAGLIFLLYRFLPKRISA
jgi:hypothetical protein